MFAGFFNYIIRLVIDVVVKKIADFAKLMIEKKNQQIITDENLKKVQNETDPQKKLKDRIDLLNGEHNP